MDANQIYVVVSVALTSSEPSLPAPKMLQPKGGTETLPPMLVGQREPVECAVFADPSGSETLSRASRCKCLLPQIRPQANSPLGFASHRCLQNQEASLLPSTQSAQPLAAATVAGTVRFQPSPSAPGKQAYSRADVEGFMPKENGLRFSAGSTADGW